MTNAVLKWLGSSTPIVSFWGVFPKVLKYLTDTNVTLVLMHVGFVKQCFYEYNINKWDLILSCNSYLLVKNEKKKKKNGMYFERVTTFYDPC